VTLRLTLTGAGLAKFLAIRSKKPKKSKANLTKPSKPTKMNQKVPKLNLIKKVSLNASGMGLGRKGEEKERKRRAAKG